MKYKVFALSLFLGACSPSKPVPPITSIHFDTSYVSNEVEKNINDEPFIDLHGQGKISINDSLFAVQLPDLHTRVYYLGAYVKDTVENTITYEGYLTKRFNNHPDAILYMDSDLKDSIYVQYQVEDSLYFMYNAKRIINK